MTFPIGQSYIYQRGVSKEALGPQECIPPSKNIHDTIYFTKGKKGKTIGPIFSFVFFEISFV